MDPTLATLLGASIAGLTGIVSALLANWFNLRQAKMNFQSRLTEIAFSSKLEAYADFAGTMLPVCEAFKRLNEHVSQHLFEPGEGLLEPSLGAELAALLNTTSTRYMEVYYRRRMYLTPQMEAIAAEFLDKILLFKDVSGNDNLINFLDALERRDIRWSELERLVEDLTTEMRDYLVTVEQGRSGNGSVQV